MTTGPSPGMSSADVDRWDEKYVRTDPPPWEINKPQSVLVELAASGRLRGRVLDLGCGTAEHAILAAQHGAQVLGVDISPNAVRRATEKARDRGAKARFVVGDALRLDLLGEIFDVVIDSGLFHTFDAGKRSLYASSLAKVVRPEGVVYLTCVSDRQVGDWGPRRVGEAEIRATFAAGWVIDELRECSRERRAERESPAKAWLATIRRVVSDQLQAPPRFLYRHEARRPLAYEPVFRSFEPSFYIPRPGLGGFLSGLHEGLPAAMGDIYGKLAPGDHHKLYEAAYFSRGPMLEIGRMHGKSTVILAMGLRDGKGSERRPPFYSVELSEKDRLVAESHLRELGLLELVTLVQGDSATVLAGLPGRFDTVFVDGDHSYDGVMRDLHALEGRIEPGGVAMFHDCFHPANATGDYGVARALDECTEQMGLAYRGRFGAIALFEHIGGEG